MARPWDEARRPLRILSKVAASIGRVVDGASYIGLILTALLILLIAAMVLVDVVFRLAGHSLLFISNLVLVSAVWLAYSGVAQTHRVDGHVGVDTVLQALPRRVRAVVAVFNEIVCIVVTVVVLWSAWQQLSLSYSYKVVMLGSLRMPVWIAQAAVVIGMSLLLLQCLKKLGRRLRGDAAPRADH